MRNRNALLVGVSILCSTGAFAHEGGGHTKLMGTVRSMDQDQMVVKTTNGKEESIRLDDQTSCSEAKRDSNCSSIKPGDRVVVTTRRRDGSLFADEVRFSSGSMMKSPESSNPVEHDGNGHSHMGQKP